MKQRHRNHGLRKICDCPRRAWSKCGHAWYLNFKDRGGPSYRFSLDTELGRHIASKTEAQNEADRIKVAIREGTFRRRSEAPAALTPAPETITLRDFTTRYLERRGKTTTAQDRSYMNQLAAFVPPGEPTAVTLGDRSLSSITTDQYEVLFASLRRRGRAASTTNKYRRALLMMFRWAVKNGYLTRNPIADSETITHASEKGARRSRRLVPDLLDANGTVVRAGEERRLLTVAGPALQRLIIGALETAMRRGELVNLKWQDVDLTRRTLKVRAETSKNRKLRLIPISARLAAVLDMARTDPAGQEYGPHDYVFGELGRKITDSKRAWTTAVLKAHGHTPKWKRGATLAPESRAALLAVDLHFHDLRHEAGSRLIESGWPVHHVKDMLGHASLEQTTTYLNATYAGLEESMRRSDEARSRCKPVANEGPIEHRLPCNETSSTDGKVLVN